MLARGQVGFLGIWLVAAPAHAQLGDSDVADEHGSPPTVVEPAQAEPRSRWYGAPILIGDGLAYACLLTAAGFESKAATILCLPPGLAGYVLVGPITHAVHGNWGRSALSVGVRGLLPIVGLAASLGADQGCGDRGDCGDAALGGLLAGMLVATVLDVALLAREPSKPRPATTAPWQPTLGITRTHAVLGASGSF